MPKKQIDNVRSCGKLCKTMSTTRNYIIDDDKSYCVPIPKEFIPSSSFHLDTSLLNLTVSEMDRRSIECNGKLDELIKVLNHVATVQSKNILFNKSDDISDASQAKLNAIIDVIKLLPTSTEITGIASHNSVPPDIPVSIQSVEQSPIVDDTISSMSCKGRKSAQNGAIHVTSKTIWYESYVEIEPLPSDMVVDRDVESVKHEFTHILNNEYTTSSKKKINVDDVNICTCLPPDKALNALIQLKNPSPSHSPMDFVDASEHTSLYSRVSGLTHHTTDISRDDLEAYSRRCCGDRCINRLCYCECDPQFCPCGNECTNQMFRKHEYQHLVLFYAPHKGWGIKASYRILKGTFVMEYVGEVISQRESEIRRNNRKGQVHMYYMSLNTNQLIDATMKGNASRFINHSCDPNCETQKWSTGSKFSIGIFAIRDILPGEELTFDYQFERIGNISTMCFCGSAKCRHMLGKNRELPNTNNLPLKDRITRNRLFLCDSVVDVIDKIITPTTLLPCTCRSLVQTMMSYFKNYDTNYFLSSILSKKQSLKRERPSVIVDTDAFISDIVCTEEDSMSIVYDEENENGTSESCHFSRFSSRGLKLNWNSSLLLNRNISSGLNRYSWMYSKEKHSKIGLVDKRFKRVLVNKSPYSIVF